jgi:hypothetical protein
VLSGVESTDRIVDRGAGFLKDGDTVRVVESDERGAVAQARNAGGST